MQASTISALTPNNTANSNGNGKPVIAPEFAFDKILTREIGDRSSAPPLAAPANPSKPQVASPPANQNPQSNQKLEARQANKTPASPTPPAKKEADASETADASQTDTANIAKGESSSSAADEQVAQTEESTTTPSTDASQVLPGSAMPVDMLALVASFNQANLKPSGSGSVSLPQASLGLANAKVQDSNPMLANNALPTNLNAETTADLTNPTAQNPQAFAAMFDQAALAGKEKPTVQLGETLASKTALPGEMAKAEPELAELVEGGKASLPKLAAGSNPLASAKNTPSNTETLPKISEITTGLGGKAALDTSSLVANNKLMENLLPPSMVAPLAQANAQFSQIAAVKANERVAPMVGSEGWDSAVGQKMVWMVAAGQQSAELTLNPPDMGPMQVVLKISNEEASVSFTAAQPEVRQALEAALPKLREMMSEAGVNLTSSSVSTSLPNHQQSGGAANEDRAGNGNRNGGQLNGSLGGEENGVQSGSQTIRRVSAGLGAVDTFA